MGDSGIGTGGQSEPPGEFDTAGIFDDDYLHFYAGMLSDERSDADAELIWRLLGLEPGSEVLDLACGHGRIANRLAARGCLVTGLDASPLFLEHARADAARAGLTVDYVLGDMRALPYRRRFDAVVNWFTSFGYFSDQDDRAVLEGVCAALRPGGRFLLEIQHRDNLMSRLLPFVVTERGGDLMVDQNTFDVQHGRMISRRTIVRGGRARTAPFFVRIFGYTEIRDWLHAAGFAGVEGFGQEGEPLTIGSRRLLALATAPSSDA